MSEPKLDGVWALFTLVDGTNLVGRIKGAESSEEILSLDDGWIEIEEACTYHVQMAQVQGGSQALFSMCLPFAASPDSDISTRIRLSNVSSYCAFDKMPERTRRMMASKIKDSKSTATKLAAASAGIMTR
jgi:hypothetical protein